MAEFKVGDKVRRNGRGFGALCGDMATRTVEEVFASGWFNHDGGEDHDDYSPEGGCGPLYWELVAPTSVQHVSSRSNDPVTSKAAGKVKRDGLRNRIGTLFAVEALYACTGHEIANYVDAPLNSVTPRLAELRREGKIKDSGQRRDKQIVWVLA